MGFVPTSEWQVYDGTGRRKYLNADERRRCLRSADAQEPVVRALCYLLLFSGCRVSEALSLTHHQIDVPEQVIWLRTLKRRQLVFRRIPLPPKVIDMLAALPPAKDGRIWTVHRTTAWRWITDIAAAAKIEGPMACCRGMRHSYAMHAAARQVPPYALRRFMGHASLQTTLIYVDAVGLEEREFAQRMW